MLKTHSIMATNAIITLPDNSRERIADEGLEGLARQINEQGGRPQLIEHDWLKLCGWVHKAWTVRDGESLKLVAESLIPESQDDWSAIKAIYFEYMAAWEARRIAPFERMLGLLKQPDVRLVVDADCVYLHAPGIAKRLCRSVFSNVDDDGLIPLSEVTIDEDLRITASDFLLVPSSTLRPGQSLPNVPNRAFMKSFLRLAKTDRNCDPRLSFDEDLLGIPDSWQPMELREFWWGPPYSGSPSDQAYGVTVHGPTKYDQLSGLLRTEFWWYGKTERTFEIEELVDHADMLSSKRPFRAMRFVHSIFEGDKNVARHLDGALRIYTESQWQLRNTKNTNISNFGKQAERIKIWRVDGTITLENWYHLIHMFYKGNFTIAEYFGLPDPESFRQQLELRFVK